MEYVSGAVQWVMGLFHRFVEGTPRNQYERAVFQAIRSILIAAFLKPFKENHAVTTT